CQASARFATFGGAPDPMAPVGVLPGHWCGSESDSGGSTQMGSEHRSCWFLKKLVTILSRAVVPATAAAAPSPPSRQVPPPPPPPPTATVPLPLPRWPPPPPHRLSSEPAPFPPPLQAPSSEGVVAAAAAAAAAVHGDTDGSLLLYKPRGVPTGGAAAQLPSSRLPPATRGVVIAPRPSVTPPAQAPPPPAAAAAAAAGTEETAVAVG
ncbi:unnamed protein product, partial [Ectocarpus sp. 12 AP-2014]